MYRAVEAFRKAALNVFELPVPRTGVIVVRVV